MGLNLRFHYKLLTVLLVRFAHNWNKISFVKNFMISIYYRNPETSNSSYIQLIPNVSDYVCTKTTSK